MKFLFKVTLLFIITTTILFSQNKNLPFPPDKNPWPSIRKERIEKLLPEAMQRAGIDSWIVICRENNNDPLAKHVGGENAGGTAAFLFFLEDESVKSIAISPVGEATALKEVGLHDEVVLIDRGENIYDKIKKIIDDYYPEKIGINSSERNITDGLSYTQRINLENALGEELNKRLVSADDLIVAWLEVKLPAEIEIMRRAALLTDQLEREAYSIVIPGVTKDSDVAKYLKKRMKELGVEDAWAPDQNPNVNSGIDRGHSHSTDKIIQPGDFIQTDFGIKVYNMWVTDIQRFAYVLPQGETEIPEEALNKWLIARKGSRIVVNKMAPGIRGFEVDKAQREWMIENNSLPVMWSTGHPVGYWAHDVGPALGGGLMENPYPSARRELRPGNVFAYDGFYKWYLNKDENKTKTISVEEMAVVTDDGANYLIPPQEDLILIFSKD